MGRMIQKAVSVPAVVDVWIEERLLHNGRWSPCIKRGKENITFDLEVLLYPCIS